MPEPSKYQNILEKCNFSFSFKTVSFTDIEKEMSFNTNKASHSSDIPTKILKQDIDFFTPFIEGYVDKSISSTIFFFNSKVSTYRSNI